MTSSCPYHEPNPEQSDSSKESGSDHGAVDSRDTSCEPSDSPLGHLNTMLHNCLQDFTGRARERVASGKVTVILRMDDRLLFSSGEHLRCHKVNGHRYHRLKALAHIPALAHLLHANRGNDPQPGQWISQSLDECAQWLDEQGLKQAAIRTAIDALIVNGPSLANSGLTEDQQALSVINEFQQRCVRAAATDEVDALLSIMRRYRNQLDEQVWQATHFVVCGGHQPRYKQLSKNFFMRFLQKHGSTEDQARHRVIYSETCTSLDDARQLVAERLVNGHLAKVFLNSSTSLDKDVLGDAGLAAMDAAL